jgi:hypothetical protein
MVRAGRGNEEVRYLGRFEELLRMQCLRREVSLLLLVFLAACVSGDSGSGARDPAPAQIEAPLVQPGAPGQAARRTTLQRDT